jgi:hypothetical protein
MGNAAYALNSTSVKPESLVRAQTTTFPGFHTDYEHLAVIIPTLNENNV